MKPTLKEIKDNYERVLLRLRSGELAGIVDADMARLQVLRKTHWLDGAITTSDLDTSYNRKNAITDFNIDAIAFMNDADEVDYYINNYDPKNIAWDWDINNPHNLKFKKGDVVKICKSESRIYYDQMRGRIGTIIDAEYKQYVDDERITYRVRVDDYKNEYQEQGLWVFHDESSLELYNPQCDDKMDTCEYWVSSRNMGKSQKLEIFKKSFFEGVDNMNNILNIYENRKREKINKHYEQLMELTKLADERYAIFKDCSDKLDKLYKEDGVITHSLVEPRLAETTRKHLEKLAELREEECCKLETLIREVHAQLSMCETYEQKQNVLNNYKIFKSNGKINA